DGQVADDAEFAARITLDPLAGEMHRRKFLDVEEIGGTKMVVALFLSRIDRRDVDRDVDGRLRRIRLIELDRSGDAPEATARGGDHQMLDGERDLRMCAVYGPGRAVGSGHSLNPR